MDAEAGTSTEGENKPRRPVQDLLDEANRSYATKQFSEAIETYSLALEQL